jgi:ATP-dependent exoDNAse (exonuclease V) alpha subunit
MDDKDFYILYRCDECENASNNVGRALTGADLSLIDLFYAGTTHKLQGSQAKIIIAPLGVVNFKGFITRNMMYTVYTRGQELVFALGSVSSDKSSMLSIARSEVAERDVLTIGEIL